MTIDKEKFEEITKRCDVDAGKTGIYMTFSVHDYSWLKAAVIIALAEQNKKEAAVGLIAGEGGPSEQLLQLCKAAEERNARTKEAAAKSTVYALMWYSIDQNAPSAIVPELINAASADELLEKVLELCADTVQENRENGFEDNPTITESENWGDYQISFCGDEDPYIFATRVVVPTAPQERTTG